MNKLRLDMQGEGRPTEFDASTLTISETDEYTTLTLDGVSKEDRLRFMELKTVPHEISGESFRFDDNWAAFPSLAPRTIVLSSSTPWSTNQAAHRARKGQNKNFV